MRARLEWIDSWYTLQFFSELVEGTYVHSIARREPRRLPACFCGSPDSSVHCLQNCFDSQSWMTRRGSGISQGRVSNPSEGHRRSSAEGAEGVRSWDGAVPPLENFFCISYIKTVSFYAFPVIFIDTVTANRYERKPSHLSCKKSVIVLLYIYVHCCKSME